MTDYGKAIGGILGTAMVLNVTGKHLLPSTKKLFKQMKMKGGLKNGVTKQNKKGCR